jgi:hypothetical protein
MFKSVESYQTWPLIKRIRKQYLAHHSGKLVLAIICMMLVAATKAAIKIPICWW